MFFGGLSESKEEIPIVEIPDVDCEIFDKFLLYVYTKKINFESIDEANNVFYVARKYEVIDLEYQCMNYIRSELSPANACMAYELAVLFDDLELKGLAEKMFQDKTADVLAAPEFLDANITSLNGILEQKEVTTTSELDLFKALEKYAEANECIELVQEEAVKKIQFLKMSQEDFANGPMKSKLLNNEDKIKIAGFFMTGKDASAYYMPDGFTTTADRITHERTDATIVRKLEWLRQVSNPPFFQCPHYREASIQHIVMKCPTYQEGRPDMVKKLIDNEVFSWGPSCLYSCLTAIQERNDIASLKILCDFIRFHDIDKKFLYSY